MVSLPRSKVRWTEQTGGRALAVNDQMLSSSLKALVVSRRESVGTTLLEILAFGSERVGALVCS